MQVIFLIWRSNNVNLSFCKNTANIHINLKLQENFFFFFFWEWATTIRLQARKQTTELTNIELLLLFNLVHLMYYYFVVLN